MPGKFVLDVSEKDKVLLGKDLSLDETVEVLDILRRVDGLVFDFHKTLYPKDKKKDEVHRMVQEVYKKFISENSKIPRDSIYYVGTLGSESLARLDSYILETRYFFGNSSSREVVDSIFEQGYARVKTKMGATAAIVSFEGRPILRGDFGKYSCKLNNIAYNMKIHQEPTKEIRLAEEYQERLFKVLEDKLLVPTFVDFD
ncbi:MAG: hypothetical protein AABX93_00570 [Nanoarchaeota archaeon]